MPNTDIHIVEEIDKKEIRQALRGLRRSLTQEQQFLAAKKLAKRVERHQLIQKASNIAFYWPADGELSPLGLIEALDKKCNLFLPCIRPNFGMLFKQFKSESDLNENGFGIPEPTRGKLIKPQHLDIIFMPLVAFDHKGNRLGMGGGYYDRCLAFKNHQHWRKAPVLVGLAHDFQELGSIYSNNWDVPLDYIATPEKVLRLK